MIRKGLMLGAVAVVLLLTGPRVASASFTLDIYENYAGLITLPEVVLSGYVVLLDSGDPSSDIDQHNVQNWSDVVDFIDDGGGSGRTLKMFSDAFDGVNDPNDDTDMLGIFNDVFAHPHTFLSEDPSGITTYDVGNVYYIHSDGPETTPEPNSAALALIGLGIFGAGAVARRRFI